MAMIEAEWHKQMPAAEKSTMRRSTILAKASICDTLAKHYPRGFKPFQIAHFSGTGVLPAGIDDPKIAAEYWRAHAANR